MAQDKEKGDPLNNRRDVLEVEVLDPENGADQGNSGFRGNYGARGAYGRAFYRGGPGNIWIFPSVNSGGCLAPAISFALFMICLAQYGLLAAIGFFVIHVIGSILGSVRAARMLAMGLPFNPWAWRAGNWIISFFLTVWLAGGLAQ